MPGPVPTRAEERIRRNKPEFPITKIEAVGVVEQPELGLPDAHPIVVDLWKAAGESAQAKYYEPTDWQFLRFNLHFANKLLEHTRPSAQLFQAVNSAFGDLLISEGARRRVRIEVEREQAKAEVVDISELFKQRIQESAIPVNE